MKLCPVILAGGSGTRLWPLSRKYYPKQLLALYGQGSLLQQTVSRLEGLDDYGDLEVLAPLVVCNEDQRFLIMEQLREMGEEPASILLEPIARNTAPALTFAALTALAEGEDTVLVVMPADHVIRDTAAFHEAILSGMRLAGQGMIGTFGIVPDSPETGYGYIRKGADLDVQAQGNVPSSAPGAFRLAAFVEKPDLDTAQRYLDSGEYLWNSGMFILTASVWLNVLGRFNPRMLDACRGAREHGRADGLFYHLHKGSLETCPSDSIDYAVMEHLAGVQVDSTSSLEPETLPQAAVVPLSAGWSDVGAWPALMEIHSIDKDGNVSDGDVFTWETHNSLLMSKHRLLAAVGVEDMVIIETADAVLVCPSDRAQDVKRVVKWLEEQDRYESRTHRRVYRPWGSYEGLDSGERFQVKRLTVNPGQALSLQMHHHRSEHWVVVRGTARITLGEEVFLLTENQSTYIPVGTRHRLENPGQFPLEIIEVQSGGYLGEDDIVRLEDKYNREDSER